MGERGLLEWENDSERYTEYQVEQVLEEIGIDVISVTLTNLLCLCPYHGNSDSPALSVSKLTGLFMCFNPGCDQKGNLVKLVSDITGLKYFPAMRLIASHKGKPFSKSQLELILSDEVFPTYSQSKLDVQYKNFWETEIAITFMRNRGFDDETLKHFGIGYSITQGIVTIPMHDKYGTPLGVIGRSPFEKVFKNSPRLPTSKTLFNLHRAKKIGSEVIIVESAMDVMWLHQCGIENVIATCGGFFTDYHQQLVNRHFSSVINATDFDQLQFIKDCRRHNGNCIGHNPGRALGEKIVAKLPNLKMRWAAYEDGIFYPHSAKDFGECTEAEIKQCLKNKITDSEYNRWKNIYPDLAIV